MKKHFLLLVMALMSMATWAATDISTFEMRTTSVEYGNAITKAKIAIYDPGVISGGDNVIPSEGYEWDGKVYTDAACTKEATTTPLAVATYYVKVTGTGAYKGEKIGEIDVIKKTVSVSTKVGSALAQLTKTYGEKDPEFEFVYDAADFVGDDDESVFTGEATLAPHKEDAGTWDIVLTGVTATNYEAKLEGEYAKMLINQKNLSALSVPAEDLKYEALYQGKQIVPEFNIKDGKTTLAVKTKTGGDYEVAYANPETDGINARTDAYTATITGIGNYTGTLSAEVTIKKAPISVAVNNVEVKYKQAAYENSDIAAAASFTYYGFVGADVKDTKPSGLSAEPTVTLAKGSDGKDVTAIDKGEYALKVSVDGLTATNYEISALNDATPTTGKLIIKPMELTVLVSYTDNGANSKSVGQADKAIKYTTDPVITPRLLKAATTSPKADAVYEKTFTTEPVFTREAGEDVGYYAITLKTEGVTSSNFTVKEYKGTVIPEGGKITDATVAKYTINKAAVTVVVLNQEKTYGEKDPETLAKPVAGTHFIVTPATSADALEGVVLERTEGENAGEYVLTANFDALGDNFSVTNVPGKFTIKQKELKVTAQAQTLATGSTVAALNQNLCTVEGLVEGDAADKVFALTFDTDASGAAVAVDGEGKLNTPVTYNNGIIATLLTDKTKKELGGNYTWAAKNPVAGKLIVVNAAGTVILNRVAKDDYADETKNDAAAEIAKAAKADKDGDKKIDLFNATFSDFEMIAQKWYPIVLPFETSVAEISSMFNYAVVNVLNEENTDETKISFKLHMGKIAANTPFVVKVYGADDKADNKVNMNTITFGSKTFIAPADYEAVTVEDASGVKFIGTYKGKIDGFRANEYYFSASASLNEYYKGNDTNKTYLRPLGAYFQVPATSAARVIEFEEADGTVTAISAVAFENGITSAEGWYTIGGMKLQGAPTQKGIYIQNGKKVIVK